MLVAALLATSGCLGQARADTVMVFNEIMYHPIADEAGEEWIEFHNQMGVDVDISDWRVAGDTEYIFPIGSRIPGRGYLVLARDPVHLSAVTGLTTNVFGPFLSPLDNQGGTLELRDNSGKLMDRVEFGTEGDWPVTPDGAGPSVAKRNPDLSSAPGVNWAASQQRGGTPGTDNFPIVMAPVTVAFNELSGTAGPAFWLELMNWGTNPVPLGNCYLHHDGVTNSAYWFPPGTSLAPGACLSLANDVLGFVAPAPGEKLFLFVTNETAVHDGVVLKAGPRARSPDGIGVWRHPAAPTPGASNQFVFPDEIVINEIMYRHRLSPPEAPGERPMEDPEEWVELFNRDTNAVDLSGWEIDGGIGFHFPIGTVIPPGGYLVVARNAATLRQRHPDAAIVGNFSGNLNNSSDTILLRDAADNPADCVTYFDGGRWRRRGDLGRQR